MHSTVRPQAKSLSHPPIPQRLSWGEFRGLVRDLILFVPIHTDPDCLGRHPRYKDNYLFKERKIASSLYPGLQSQSCIWSSWRSTHCQRADFYFQLSCFTEYWPWALRHLTLYKSIPIYPRVFWPSKMRYGMRKFSTIFKVLYTWQEIGFYGKYGVRSSGICQQGKCSLS